MTMKKLLLMVAAASVVASCSKLPMEGEKETAANVSLTVEEAKAYFETDYKSLKITKVGSADIPAGWISPGDFTPIWNSAVESANGNTASVDVPIIPTYRYRAIRAVFANGRAQAYSVDIYQKLVVVRKHYDDGREDRMGQYILTLIPDKGYATKHKGNVAERFINTGNKGSYSGLAVYYLQGIPMRLEKYSDGEKTGWISLFGVTDDLILKSKFEAIIRELGKIEILRSKAIKTRYGEDDWEWDYGDTDDYTDMGDGIYQDDEGDYYIDWDGDGNIDSGYIMPGDPVTPDEPDPVEEEPDDNDTELLPPVDYGDGNEWSDADHDGWNPDDGDEGIQIPDRLTKEYGKVEYYRARVADFYKRFDESEKTVPPYYKEYGEKYCERFITKTRPQLSDAGKEWVDKTTVALQVKLSDILVKNPEIELTPESLEEKAFESHVDAYIESGILSLPMSDKIEILLTVDYNDLVLKAEGREQAGAVIWEQLKYYVFNLDVLFDDAEYMVDNFGNIIDRIREYIPDTKSGSVSAAEKEVYDLLLKPLIEYYEENVPGFSVPDIY